MTSLSVLGLLAQPLVAQPVFAQSRSTDAGEPENILPRPHDPSKPSAQATATPTAVPTATPGAQPTRAPNSDDLGPNSAPVIQDITVSEPVMPWSLADARALLTTIEHITSEGLLPADYQPSTLKAAIAAGEGDALDAEASKVFGWLIEDLRDGRTPMKDRLQWFAVDPDQDDMPTAKLMAEALSTHDVAGIVARLAPTNPDYAALKAALAATPRAQTAKRLLIMANMDRWRWLKHDLGDVYLMTNVPEFQLRLVVRNKIIRTYKTVVGKPGRTATPQLAETVTAVVFNPTWTVPQSITKGEGLGQKVLANPNWARNAGYKATKDANGNVWVVQQPGPNNSLGLMKIDMPNEHAIYLHDTPSKQYFNEKVRAFSHGCIRTERAVELGMTMAILGAGMSASEAADISRSGKYTKVPMTRTFPVYLTYFTQGTNIDGQMQTFDDIYGRDKPVLESFQQPRELKTDQRESDEEIIKLDNPL
ncbi:L,D-transpeptidase family protein [Novosphingobium sp. 1949]|uniref:L,D-transpeptidase family protein n=1 Tax=Novosphingobium organovorum TaxID=2930092 RepID=A0ABT0BAN0_9SPHN|nr:L,D-transpeptidase family protein [Novosphingobium organovorum]MCJ2182127.1 L,D-transpeptidase family protein [Novosphingobium organovorum]